MVSKLVRHTACPKCGSRDNLAEYTDGHAWCFGCRFHRKKKFTALLAEDASVSAEKLWPLPSDTTKEIGATGWIWLKKYGIMLSETQNYRWSDSRQWLIYLIEDDAWQARMFSPEIKRKYLSRGNLSDILHIIPYKDNDEIILCEDVVSAIKIGRQTNAMPIWGSNIALKTIVRLSTRFKRLGIWLDSDKKQESFKSASRASQLPFDNVKTIISELDPKCYSDEAISQFLRS